MRPDSPNIPKQLASAGLRSANPDHGIAARVVADGPAKHLGANHALFQLVDFPVEGMSHYQTQEVLGSFAAGEGMTEQDSLKVLAHQGLLFRAEQFLLAWRN